MKAFISRTSYCVDLTFMVDGDVSRGEFMDEILKSQASGSGYDKNKDVWISLSKIRKFSSYSNEKTSMFEVPVFIWSLSERAKCEFERTMGNLFHRFYEKDCAASTIDREYFNEWLDKTVSIFWPGS